VLCSQQTQSTTPGLHSVSVHQTPPPVRGSKNRITAYYSIYRPRTDEGLSWPSWLTCSRWLTHISGHPSDAGQVQDSESSVTKDRHSTTVPCHQGRPITQKWKVVVTIAERGYSPVVWQSSFVAVVVSHCGNPFLLTSCIFLFFLPFPFYQNTSTLFPGRMSSESTKPGFSFLCWYYVICIS